MYAAVPDLHLHVAGWVVHPYTAGREVERLQRAIDQTAAHGAPRTMPLYVTEWGLASTATGVTLVPDNYGHPVNLTHAQAAVLVPKVIRGDAHGPEPASGRDLQQPRRRRLEQRARKNFGVLFYPSLAEKLVYAAAYRTLAFAAAAKALA